MRKRGLTTWVIVGGGLLLALTVVAFVTMLSAVTNLRDSSDSVQAADQRIALATEMERRVIDLETGQRGFTITGQREFLQPRTEALRALPDLQSRLLDLETKAGSDPQVAFLERLFRDIDTYVRDYSDGLVAMAASGDLAAARRIIATGEGRRRVDAIRAQFATFIRRDGAAARAEGTEADHSASTAVTFAVLGLVGVPLLILVLVWLASRTVAAPVQRIAGAAKRLRRGDLSARVVEEGAGEVHSLSEDFNEMATSLQQSRDELESQNAELEAQQGELERSVEDLGEERDRIQRFHHFVSRIAAEVEIEPLGEAMLEELAAVASADAATLYAIKSTDAGQNGGLRLVASRGFDPGLLAEAIEGGHGLAGRALVEETIVQADHGETGLELPSFGASVRVHHELHLPIGRPGAILGVISLAKLGEPGFGEAQKQRLTEKAGPAAVALANALSLEATRRAALLNEAVLESAQEAYLRIDENGVVLDWNPSAERLFGYSAEEAMGKVVTELVFSAQTDREAAAKRRKALLEKGWATYQVTAYHRDGRPIEVEAMATVMKDANGTQINYFVRDITDRLLRDQERDAAEAVSRALAETDADEDLITPIIAALAESFDWPLGGFWEQDPADGLVHCTHIWTAPQLDFPEFAGFAKQITYRPGGEVPDFPILKDAWDSESTRWHVPRPEKLSERQETAGEAGLRAALAVPVFGGQRMRGLLTFGSPSAEEPDATRLASLRSITDLIGQVMERRIAEQEAERLKNEFFALVSHELRTPLTSITGYLDIVRDEEAGEINDDQRHYLSVIDRNARRLTRLVGDLLFVAQVGAGRMALKKGKLDLAKLATDAVEAARPFAEKQGVLLAAETEPATMLAGDGDRIGQLIDNLVSNAIKFTPDGGSVTVRVRDEGNRARIEVADTGMGISQSDMENLFERFYRTDHAIKQAIPGIGLGLSISKAIAEGHGGEISLHSEEGRGTTFIVELPLGASAEGNGGPPATNGGQAAKANGGRATLERSTPSRA